MSIPMRFLAGVKSSAAEAPNSVTVESDYIVIMAALLCALICSIGLVVAARWVCLRRSIGGSDRTNRFAPYPPANKGLKKSILRSLPRVTYDATINGKLADCVICLTELVDGDEIRVLPQCGHGFHVNCIDTWLGSHSSCPSCRQILVVARCQNCGGFPANHGSGAERQREREVERKSREDGVNRFLP